MKDLISFLVSIPSRLVKFTISFLKKLINYVGYILAVIAGAKNITGFIIVIIALGTTLFFARSRRTVDVDRPSAGKQNPFVDGIYFFAIQVLIVFVAYLLGYFITSGGGEMFGMWIREEVLRIPAES